MKKSLLLLLFLIQGLALQAEIVLDYETYSSYVKNNLPEIVKSRLNEEIAKRSVQKARGVSDVKMNGSINYFNNDLSDSTGTNSGITGEAGLSKRFITTGTELYGSTGYTRSVINRDNSEVLHQPSVTLGVRQPLLYNFLGSVDKYAEEDAKISYEIEKVQTMITSNALFRYYTLLYNQWIMYSKISAINQKGIANAWTIYNQMISKQKSGLAENDEVQKAYSSLLSFRQKKEQSLIDEMKIKEEIAVQVGADSIRPVVAHFDTEYNRIKKHDFEYRPFNSTVSAQRVDLLVSRLKLSRDTAANKLRPSVDAVASITQWGNDENFSGLVSYDKTDYKVGVEVTHSFGNNSAEATYEIAALELLKMQEDLRAAVLNYETEIRSIQVEAQKTKNIT
jgi:hypothetical protein